MDNKLKDILLVSGSGRNVGKTTFIQKLITQEKGKNLIAIKISPHFHEPTKGLQLMVQGKGWKIFLETNPLITKDSSLYLKSGAEKSYFIQSEKTETGKAFNKLKEMLPEDFPIIVESAGLRNFIHPGLYIKIFSTDDEINKGLNDELMKTDLIVLSDKKQFFPDPVNIIYKNGWQLNLKR